VFVALVQLPSVTNKLLAALATSRISSSLCAAAAPS